LGSADKCRHLRNKWWDDYEANGGHVMGIVVVRATTILCGVERYCGKGMLRFGKGVSIDAVRMLLQPKCKYHHDLKSGGSID
jgi:hypothetical protein